MTNTNSRASIVSMNGPLRTPTPLGPAAISALDPVPISLKLAPPPSIRAPKAPQIPPECPKPHIRNRAEWNALQPFSGADPLGHRQTAAPGVLPPAPAKGATRLHRRPLIPRRPSPGVPNIAGSASPTCVKTSGAPHPCAASSRLYRMQPPNLEGPFGPSCARGATW